MKTMLTVLVFATLLVLSVPAVAAPAASTDPLTIEKTPYWGGSVTGGSIAGYGFGGASLSMSFINENFTHSVQLGGIYGGSNLQGVNLIYGPMFGNRGSHFAFGIYAGVGYLHLLRENAINTPAGVGITLNRIFDTLALGIQGGPSCGFLPDGKGHTFTCDGFQISLLGDFTSF